MLFRQREKEMESEWKCELAGAQYYWVEQRNI